MKSATATYWMPVTVRQIEHKPSRYEGFGESTPNEIDEWFTQGLENFTHIYGTVVDAYYMVGEVITNEEGNYDFMLNIVVTGLVDGPFELRENIYDYWPKDIVEQLKVISKDFSFNNIIEWDYNPVLNNPEWEKYNY